MLPGVIAALEDSGLLYEVMECDPALADTAAFCAAYGVPLERSVNTILVASKRPPGRFAACAVLATTKLDVNGKVCALMEVRKASFASAEETMAVTGMMVGGVTPFGLPASVPVYIDSRIIEPSWVVFGAGSRSAKIRLDPSGLGALAGVSVVADLALTRPSDQSDEPA